MRTVATLTKSLWDQLRESPQQINGPAPHFTLLALACFYLLSPFYFVPSGLPQPAHVVLLMLFVVAICNREHHWLHAQRHDVLVWLFVAYVAWTIVINIIRLSEEITIEPFFYSVYYGFNSLSALGLFAILSMRKIGKQLFTVPQIIFAVAAITLLLQLAISQVGIGRAYEDCRSMNFFNNPNQLGYFSVLMSTLGAFVGQKGQVPRALIYCVLVMGLLLSLFSMSRAAIVASGALFGLFLIFYERDIRVWAVVAASGFLILVLGPFHYFALSDDPSCRGRVLDTSVPTISKHEPDPANEWAARLSAKISGDKIVGATSPTLEQAREKLDLEIRQLQNAMDEARAQTASKQKALARELEQIPPQTGSAVGRLEEIVAESNHNERELSSALADYERRLANAKSTFAEPLPVELERTPEQCRERSKEGESEFMHQLRYRQYHHLFIAPERLILGAGDGRNARFCGLEIHSTLGAVLLYNGVVGLILFGLMMLRTILVDWRGALLVLAPAMLYGLAHNGLRHPLLFGLMAAVVATTARSNGTELVRAG